MEGKKFLEQLEEDHPIKIKSHQSNEFKVDVINLIDLLNEKKVENLDSKLNELKRDKVNWESYMCELEFCKKIIRLSPKFIPSRRSGSTPDLKILLNGKEIFFEVKLLKDIELSTELFKRLSQIISDYIIIITYDPSLLSKEYIEKAYQLVLDKIKEHKIGKFNIKDVLEIEIREKKGIAKESKKNDRTLVNISMKKAVQIDLNMLKRKILLDFYDKIKQLNSVKNIFWVIDMRRWQYSINNLKSIFYGDIIIDYTIGIKNFVGFDEIYEVFRKKPEILNNTNLLPYFSYPKKNGLFFNEDFKILNGVIGIKNNKSSLIVNPFARNQLDVTAIRKLKEVIDNG